MIDSTPLEVNPPNGEYSSLYCKLRSRRKLNQIKETRSLNISLGPGKITIMGTIVILDAPLILASLAGLNVKRYIRIKQITWGSCWEYLALF